MRLATNVQFSHFKFHIVSYGTNPNTTFTTNCERSKNAYSSTEWNWVKIHGSLHLCYYKCYVKIQEPSTSPGKQCQKSHQIWNLYLYIILKVPNVRCKIYSYTCYAHQFYYPSCPTGISNIVLRQVRVNSLCKTRIQVIELYFNQCCFAGWHNSRQLHAVLI